MSPVLLGRVSGSQAFASLASLRRVSREVFELTYVDDVFSTSIWDGNSSTQTISNGIRLGDAVTGLPGYSIYATQGGNYTSVAPSGTSWQSIITDGILSGNNDNYVYSSSSVLDIYVDLVDRAVATAVKIAPQGDIGINAVYNTPSSLTVYGSNDASSWTTLDTNTGLSSSNFTEGSFTTFSFSNSTGYRYYRIAAPAFTSISEWELVATSETAGEGGLVWTKVRDYADNHYLADSERGKTGTYFDELASNTTYVSQTTRPWGITSFNSNGFSLGGDNNQFNSSSFNYCSWTFRKAPGFFDVVTYTGDGVAGREISHNLGSVPGMIIVKSTTVSRSWMVYHRSEGATKYALLDSTSSFAVGSTIWNDTEPTSTVFTVGNSLNVNGSGNTYVAYIFAHDDQSFGTNGDESIIKCGSYTGGTQPNYIDLGWEPQFVLTKRTDSGVTSDTSWIMVDTMRGMPASSGDASYLEADTADSEVGKNIQINPNSTGFSVGESTAHWQNATGGSYIYMAIRRPHKPPTAATEVFDVSVYANGSTNIGFVPDTNISKWPDGTQDWFWNARLLGDKALNSNNTDAEDTTLSFVWDQPTNTLSGGSYNGFYANYVFRRAPGFFDVVAYTGIGSATTVSHNLGVAPELMIVKCRSNNGGWAVYDATNGATKGTLLNSTSTAFTFSAYWNNTAPTSTQFTVATDGAVNDSGQNYIAYLFATLDGISKVGSYSGTGSNINVDCGFTAGARFVLIKRTDSTGDWYVWDTERGIVSGNDPYLLINSDAAEVTTTDYIDPLNAGFTVTSSAPAALNASGGTYLFLAIA